MIKTVVKVTLAQFRVLEAGGTVGAHTYDPDHCLYLIDDGLVLPQDSGRYFIRTDDDGETYYYDAFNYSTIGTVAAGTSAITTSVSSSSSNSQIPTALAVYNALALAPGISTVTTSGSGNAVTAVTYDSTSHTLTITSGQTFSLSGHTHAAGDITSGTFADARIPNLNASKITAGTFDAARIPNLNASKITAGTLDAARIPDLSGTYATVNHTHTTSLATDTGTSTITLGLGSKYKLTTGGTSVIFTMPAKPSYTLDDVTDGTTRKLSNYLPLSGGTLTGNLNLKANQYNREGALNCNNSDIIGLNAIYTSDTANNTSEGIRFYRAANKWDSLTASDGELYFMPNDPNEGTALSGAYKIIHSGTLTQHLYHQWTANTNYYDDYGGTKMFRIITENMYADLFRFQASTVSNLQYYNYDNDTWTDWSFSLNNLFDGNARTQINIPYANRKFRFEIRTNGGWPTTSMFMLQGTWFNTSAWANGQKSDIIIETRANASAAWTQRISFTLDGVMGSAARVLPSSVLHTGETYYRVTITIYPWTPTTVNCVLCRLCLFSNYNGGPLSNLTFDGNGNATFSKTLSAKTIYENGTSLVSKYLGLTATAADSTKLNGQAASYYLNYNNLTNTPTIPTVNNAKLTIQRNGSTVQTFTANSSTDVTANITVPTVIGDIGGWSTIGTVAAGTSSITTTISSSSSTKIVTEGGIKNYVDNHTGLDIAALKAALHQAMTVTTNSAGSNTLVIDIDAIT